MHKTNRPAEHLKELTNGTTILYVRLNRISGLLASLTNIEQEIGLNEVGTGT